MIRINLLPVRAAQKKEQLHSQVAIGVIVLALTLAGCIFVQITIAGKVKEAKAEGTRKQAKINQLKKEIAVVNGFEVKKKELSAKLDILENLKAQRTGPVRVLDELSRATPEKAWVESFSQSGNSVKITGMGLNQETVAAFMRTLEASPFYQNVELEVIDQKTVGGRSLESFSIRCLLESPADKKTVKGGTGK